jgi:uncharacterized membrane protein SpoIIM required for sporulation
VNLERFHATRSVAWSELEHLLQVSRGKPETLPGQDVLRLGSLYRATAADLATARRLWPSDPLVARLEGLVARGRAQVYGSAGARRGVIDFFRSDYWTMVAARPWVLTIAALLLIVPSLLGAMWATNDPASAATILPAEFRSAEGEGPEGTDLGLAVEEQAAFSTLIFTNNIQVTFMAFAAGIALGVGTGAVLLYNGLILGVVAGLGIVAERGRLVYELVVAHGVLELSCIVVAAAAGMRMGWALVEPGNRSRGRALVENAREGVLIVLGTAPWLVLAGLVEGFITPSGFGFPVVTIVGFGLAALYWGLVWFVGVRYKRAPALARR